MATPQPTKRAGWAMLITAAIVGLTLSFFLCFAFDVSPVVAFGAFFLLFLAIVFNLVLNGLWDRWRQR